MALEIKFGTDGWRAMVAREFTVENVARIAQGTADWVKNEFPYHQSVPNSISFRNVSFNCNTTAFFSSDQYIFGNHNSTEVLKPNLDHIQVQIIFLTHMIDFNSRGETCSDFSAPSFYFMQVVNEQ